MRQKLFYLSLAGISLLASIGALVYRLYSFNLLGVIISLVLVIVAFFIFKKYFEKIDYSICDIEKSYVQMQININKTDAILLVLYFIFYISSFLILWNGRMEKSIISPWEVLSPSLFLTYFFSILLLALICFKKIKNTIFLIMLQTFLSFSVLLIVFKIGYGYDPFIHQATLALIEKKGAVDPKPFYYLGQYSLIFLIHKISFISIAFLDKILAPLLASIYIPGSIYIFFKKNFCQALFIGENKKEKSFLLVALLLFLMLPFSYFTLTTPQNLAFLFLILTIFFGINSSDKKELILAYLLAITTFLIHPLSGIPAILFLIFLTIYNLPYHELKKIIYIIIFFVTIFSLPILFYITEKSTPTPGAQEEKADAITISPGLFSSLGIPNEDGFILNFVYLFKYNYSLILLALIATALIVSYKKRARNRKLAICASFFVCLFVSYILTSQIDFNFLIDYERQNYSVRILTTAIIFLLPIFGYIFYKIIERISIQNKFIKISFLIFFCLLITASFYTSYPRKDDYFNSRSFSVGKNDIEAVDWIEKDAQSNNYVALANQQVSVAALWRFGFTRYLKDNNYFYPIPTGGKLYGYYLDMVYDKPTREIMRSAMILTGAEKGYFVLNKYWWAFDKILEEAKIEASSFTQINNGEIYIFKYE